MKHIREDYNPRIQDSARLIPQDEPVFLLRGQDKAAPATLRAWAALHKAIGGDPQMANMAMDHASAMEQWQETHGGKVADL